MSRATRVLLALALAAGVAVTASAAAAEAAQKEQSVKRSDLPDAVQAAADRESAGATVRGFSKAIVKGQLVYEMDLTVDGHPRAVLIGADGNVFQVEDEVPFAQLPAEIQAGLKQTAGKGTIGKVTAISKNTAVTGYQAQVITKGKSSKIEVGVDGKVPAPPPPSTTPLP